MSEKNIFDQLESYFETFWEPIVILDSKFRIYQVNKKFLEISGYENKQELLSESPSVILSQFVGEFPLNSSVKLNISDFEGKIVKTHVKSKHGIDIPVKATFQPFYRELDNNEWFIAIFILDVSHETHLRRQLNAIKEYALNTYQICGLVYRQTVQGPSAWIKDLQLPLIQQKYSNERDLQDEIIRIGLVLTTALGQGNSYTLGLSELPIDYELIAVCYTKMLEGDESEKETKNNYIIVVILFPKKLSSLIDKRIMLEKIFAEHLATIDKYTQITLEWLHKLKRALLLFDYSGEENYT